MAKLKYAPIYDITKTFEENLATGPSKQYKASSRSKKHRGNYSLLGYKLNSPFGSASCPTGSDSHYIKVMFENGFDIVTSKTRRSVNYAPNQFPNIVHIVPGKISEHHDFEALHRQSTDASDYKTLTIANSYGNNSAEPNYWVPDAVKAKAYAGDGQLLITSIVGTIQDGFDTEDYYQDFVRAAAYASIGGAMAIEINLSCPNVMNEGVLCYDKSAVLQICKLVKSTIGDIPIIAKIGYFPLAQQDLLEDIATAIDPYVAAISAINTFAAPIYNEKTGKQALPGLGRLKAGVSGHAIKQLGLDMTKRLSAIRAQYSLGFEIIGVGGVLTVQDFADYRAAGADAVLSATGAMWNANLAHEVKASLL